MHQFEVFLKNNAISKKMLRREPKIFTVWIYALLLYSE
jgi:hypothetical protein